MNITLTFVSITLRSPDGAIRNFAREEFPLTTESSAETTTASTDSCKPPRWFWAVTVLALLWYLMDTSAFVMRVFMSDEMTASMPADQQHLYRDMPPWVNVAFACEVVGGVWLHCTFDAQKIGMDSVRHFTPWHARANNKYMV